MVAFGRSSERDPVLDNLVDIASNQIKALSCASIAELLKAFEHETNQKRVIVLPEYLEDFVEEMRQEFPYIVVIYIHESNGIPEMGLRGDISELAGACAFVLQVAALEAESKIEQLLRNEGCNSICHILMTVETA